MRARGVSPGRLLVDLAAIEVYSALRIGVL